MVLVSDITAATRLDLVHGYDRQCDWNGETCPLAGGVTRAATFDTTIINI